MLPANLNYLAILAAAVAAMAIGSFWYSMAFFGKEWMKLVGLTQKTIEMQKKEGMGKTYGIMFIGALVMAYVLAVIVSLAASTTIVGGVKVGVLVWLGFVATTSLGDVLFAGKSLRLWTINNGYQLVSLVFMGAILARWV